MGRIGRNKSFFKMKVDILRPTFRGTPLAVAAKGTITNPSGASIPDGEYFELNDGVHSPVLFEFDKDSNWTSDRVRIAITNGYTTTQVRDAIITAINLTNTTGQPITAEAFTIAASSGGTGLTNIINTVNGSFGNVPLLTVSEPGNWLTITGMTGGLDDGIRDQILSDYVLDATNVRTYIEPVHSEVPMDRQLGGIEVARMVGFFNKNVDIQINDIVRENANVYNNNTIKYWKVTGKLDYSRYDFQIRVDLDLMNYQRV